MPEFEAVAHVEWDAGGYTVLLEVPGGYLVIDADRAKVCATEFIPAGVGDAVDARRAFLRRVGGLVLGGAVPSAARDRALEDADLDPASAALAVALEDAGVPMDTVKLPGRPG